MKFLPLCTIIIFLTACSGGSPVNKQLAGSDSLVINFNEPQTSNIAKTVSTTEQKAIKKLSGYVDSKTTEAFKCGYDGNLLFYKKGVLTGDVSFNYAGEGCHHFIQLINDVLTPTAMSNEAADFLKSLAEGKNWY